jgi:integrase
MRAKITKRTVDGAEPGGATYLIRDTELRGFVLVVTPAGAKSYAVDYRVGSGRGSPKRRLTIGKHGSPWTPETARAEARRTGNPYPSAAIKLLLLTGCRRGEVVNLRWEDVDFEHGYLRLPDSKTGAKIVYLNTPARALLQSLPHIAENPRVIPGTRVDSASAAIDNVWPNVRKAAGLADVRLHDLRHSFASVGAAGGLSLPIIGAVRRMLPHEHPVMSRSPRWVEVRHGWNPALRRYGRQRRARAENSQPSEILGASDANSKKKRR